MILWLGGGLLYMQGVFCLFSSHQTEASKQFGKSFGFFLQEKGFSGNGFSCLSTCRYEQDLLRRFCGAFRILVHSSHPGEFLRTVINSLARGTFPFALPGHMSKRKPCTVRKPDGFAFRVTVFVSSISSKAFSTGG